MKLTPQQLADIREQVNHLFRLGGWCSDDIAQAENVMTNLLNHITALEYELETAKQTIIEYSEINQVVLMHSRGVVSSETSMKRIKALLKQEQE